MKSMKKTAWHPSPLSEKEVEVIWNDTMDYVTNHNNNNNVLENSVKDNTIISTNIKGNNNNNKHNNSIEQKTEEILKKYHFITLEETREIYYYKDGVYIFGGEIIIEKEAEKIFGYSLANKDLSEIKGHIIRKTFHKRAELDTDVNIINQKTDYMIFTKTS